jgi:hypothetical protein
MSKINLKMTSSSQSTHEFLQSSIVVASKRQVSAELDGDVVILELGSGVYYGLSEVGRSIWNRLTKPIRVDTLCSMLMEEYDISHEQCEQETRKFLKELASYDLVEIDNE